jgi:hypothetical protein
MRHCDGCTLCCTLLPIKEIGKRAGERCMYQAAHVLLILTTVASAAETVPLKSFSYRTELVACAGLNKDQLMPFAPRGDWKMAPGFADPGAGTFPSGKFFLRRVTVTHVITGTAGPLAYAMVGHSGPNGDWISPMIVGNEQSAIISYDADAAPLVTPGEYFDIHASCESGTHWATASFWYVPVP